MHTSQGAVVCGELAILVNAIEHIVCIYVQLLYTAADAHGFTCFL